MPLHNNIINPVKAIAASTRTLVRYTMNALHGGNLALADFHVTPPFGNNISKNGVSESNTARGAGVGARARARILEPR